MDGRQSAISADGSFHGNDVMTPPRKEEGEVSGEASEGVDGSDLGPVVAMMTSGRWHYWP